MSIQIQEVQDQLKKRQIDGWLLYEFHGVNSIASNFLQIPPERIATRRLFYWIPREGNPLKIVHQIEERHLDHLLGDKRVYCSQSDLHQHLQSLLKGISNVAMEYSPMQAIPTVSKVDGGLIDLIRSFGPEIVSSASLIQEFTSVLTPLQYQLHKEAAEILEKTVWIVWRHLISKVKGGKTVTEYEIQQMILDEFRKNRCLSEGSPICGVNAHAADPHYTPTKEKHSPILEGDLVLIDLWCKKEALGAVFADITRMGVVASKPTKKQQDIFSLVRRAQREGTNWIVSQFRQGKEVLGCEVDRRVRKIIEDGGYGKYFTHRTGHHIHRELHGPGVNIDGWETEDYRPLIPGTCFSMEPGIYLPGEFGVRLEYDVFIHDGGEIEVTTPAQEAFMTLEA